MTVFVKLGIRLIANTGRFVILSLHSSRSSTVVDRFLRRQLVPCQERGITLPRIDPATRISVARPAKSRD